MFIFAWQVPEGAPSPLLSACQDLEQAAQLCRMHDVAHQLQEQIADALKVRDPRLSLHGHMPFPCMDMPLSLHGHALSLHGHAPFLARTYALSLHGHMPYPCTGMPLSLHGHALSLHGHALRAAPARMRVLVLWAVGHAVVGPCMCVEAARCNG